MSPSRARLPCSAPCPAASATPPCMTTSHSCFASKAMLCHPRRGIYCRWLLPTSNDHQHQAQSQQPSPPRSELAQRCPVPRLLLSLSSFLLPDGVVLDCIPGCIRSFSAVAVVAAAACMRTRQTSRRSLQPKMTTNPSPDPKPSLGSSLGPLYFLYQTTGSAAWSVKEALNEAIQEGGALVPFIELLNGSQMQGMLLAFIPLYFSYYNTGVYAIDMFVTTVVVTLVTALLAILGGRVKAILEWKQAELDNVQPITVKVEYYRYDRWNEAVENIHYQALAWFITNLSHDQKTGDYRMSLERDTKSFITDPDDDKIRLPGFNLIPRTDRLIQIKHNTNTISVWFDQTQQDNNNEEKRSTYTSRPKPEPPIIIRWDSSEDTAQMQTELDKLTKQISQDSTETETETETETAAAKKDTKESTDTAAAKDSVKTDTDLVKTDSGNGDDEDAAGDIQVGDKSLNVKDCPKGTLQWMKLFLEDVTKEYTKFQNSKKKRSRYERGGYGYWTHMQDLQASRGLQSVALDKLQEELLGQDLKTFHDDKDFYVRMGMPYRRGYLLSGKPGTGKTSLVNAISASYNRDLYYMNLKEIPDDNALQSSFSSVPKNSIIVLEDIDAQTGVVHSRERRKVLRQYMLSVKNQAEKEKKDKKKKKKAEKKSSDESDNDEGDDNTAEEESENSESEEDEDEDKDKDKEKAEKSPQELEDEAGDSGSMLGDFGGLSLRGGSNMFGGFTLSTLLNCLDGHTLAEGIIVIMTSNHPEVLDPALIRPGRIDLHLELGYCTRYQLLQMYRSVSNDSTAKIDFGKIPERIIAPCDAMRIMVLYRHQSDEVIIQKLLERAEEIQVQNEKRKKAEAEAAAKDPWSRFGLGFGGFGYEGFGSYGPREREREGAGGDKKDSGTRTHY
ncbi:uncharacterized protein BJ171DRAFT_566514 [Polychytrium aggregatum]|uniref:uncharacterized protein n=1 Tax=Polychytrium aggregatum TaxID=110093 RepID=UPI0022FE6F2C|nr:uncharacterized protein BJ171DRAFT_566514 [Polychytrium aggregatum]KAI9206636.1 hypothetical protein BJ171DRAFT_566514 [Polychytrium aggregatum]